MENEAVNSIKIAINLMVISLLISSILLIVNIIRPAIYEKTISIVNTADEEYQKKYEDYNQTVVSGTKIIRLLKECENLGIGIIYQTYRMKNLSDYAKNVGTIFNGATTYAPYLNNGHLCNDSRISDLSTWKYQRSTSSMYYTSYYLMKDDYSVINNNYVSAIFSETNEEYIALDGRFLSELVMNSTGDVIGIIFTQK